MFLLGGEAFLLCMGHLLNFVFPKVLFQRDLSEVLEGLVDRVVAR